MKTEEFLPNIEFGKALERALEHDPLVRQRLIKAGVRQGHVDAIAKATISERVLMMHRTTIERIAGIPGNELFYREAKRRLAAVGERNHDQLSDLATYAAFLGELRRQADERGMRETAHALGIVESRHLAKWFDESAMPSTDRLMKAIRFICSVREGITLSIPGPCEEVRALVRARQGKKNSPYSPPAIARRLGNSERTVSEWLSGSRPLPERSRPEIRRAFPELFGQIPVQREPSVKTRSGVGKDFAPRRPKPMVRAPDGSSRGSGEHRERRMIGAGLTTLRSTLDMLSATVRPQNFLDGDRAQVLDLIRKAATVAGLDEAAMERLEQVELLDSNDPIFRRLGDLIADRKTKQPRRRGT